MKKIALFFVCFFSFSAFAQQMNSQSLESGEINLGSELEVATQRFSHHFGRVWVNSANIVRYWITNQGVTPLAREGFYVRGVFFEAYTDCPRILAPSQRCTLEIRYWPAFEGFHSGLVEMQFADRNDVIIDLFGEAYRM